MHRELHKQAYNDALVHRYQHLPDVKRIQRHRHLPTPLYKVLFTCHTVLAPHVWCMPHNISALKPEVAQFEVYTYSLAVRVPFPYIQPSLAPRHRGDVTKQEPNPTLQDADFRGASLR